MNSAPPPILHPLYELLLELDSSRVHYTLSRHRPDTVLVTVTFVGERMEIDVFDDGHMEVSRFKGNEDVEGGAELVEKILAEYTELDGPGTIRAHP